MATETLKAMFDRIGAHPAAVAKKVGRSRSTVYAWLSGQKRPKPWTRLQLAKAIKVPDAKVRAALEATAGVVVE